MTQRHCSEAEKEERERNGVENKMESFSQKVISYSSYLSSSFRLLWKRISYIFMMNINLPQSHMTRSQVAWDWQRDWSERTARQTVILPTDLTLSFERLMFLGKSHSACCPVSSLQLAPACGQSEGKMGYKELMRQREWEGCGWRCEWGLACRCL